MILWYKGCKYWYNWPECRKWIYKTSLLGSYTACSWKTGRECLDKFGNLIGILREKIGYQNRVKFLSPISTVFVPNWLHRPWVFLILHKSPGSRSGLPPWLHTLSFYTKEQMHKQYRGGSRSGAPGVSLYEPSHVVHIAEQGGEESPAFSVKGTFDLSQPQQRMRQVSWKKLSRGKRKIRRLHLKSWDCAWIPNCHRSFPGSMSVCGVPTFSWVALGSRLLSQPGWWPQHRQLPSKNASSLIFC